MRVAESIELDEKTASELLTLSRARRVEARVQQRARVILLAAKGWQNKDIASEVKLDRRQVALWRRRFIEGGVQALLLDAVRSGRAPLVTPQVESHIVRTTLQVQPAMAAQWSTRTLAAHLGLSATTVRRVWQRNGIQPKVHAAVTVAVDPLPRFAGSRVDVMGLYINPRERALVLAYSEPESVQTLIQSRSSLAHPGSSERWGVGLAELAASLEALDRTVTLGCDDRHRNEDWYRFLRLIDRQSPRHLQLHLIVENQATHKRPKVQSWLAQNPRFGVQLVRPDGGWLSAVNRFFSDVSAHGIRRDSFAKVPELQQAIERHVDPLNKDRKPFLWTVSAPHTAQFTRTQAALARWDISAEQLGAPHP